MQQAQDPKAAASATGVRQCPTLPQVERPLIAHTIGKNLCLSRQREFYHKCHRCLYRGKGADFELSADATS